MKKEYTDEFNRLDQLAGIAQKELKQQRGHDFETLINKLMEEESILLRASYHTDNNKSEQIDGAIHVDGRIFLLEMKWVESNIAASDLYGFIGKSKTNYRER